MSHPFNARLAREFPGEGWTVHWESSVGRWAITGLSAEGKPITQYWGWFKDATTGANLAPHPETGLHPYRALDQTAQDEIVANMKGSWVGKTGDPLLDWSRFQKDNRDHNTALLAERYRAKGQLFADLIAAVDIRRPWVKYHTGSARARRVATNGR